MFRLKAGGNNMGRKKKTTIIEEPEESDLLESVDSASLAEEERAEKEARAIDGWLSEFQSKFPDTPVKVCVEKYVNGEWQMCRRYPLSTFEFESVHKEYGAGRYRFRMVDPSYRYIKGGSSELTFADPVLKEENAKPENPMENPLVAMMFKTMESNQTMLLGLFQSLVQAQGNQKGTGLGEIVEAVKTVQAMGPKSEKPMESFKEILTSWKLLQEITDKGEPEGRGGLMGEIREFLELAPLIKENMPVLRSMLPQGSSPLPNVSSPDTVNAAPDKNPAPSMDPLTKKIIEIVPKFTQAAKAASPPEDWGRYLLDVTDVEIVPLLLPKLRNEYGALVQDEQDVYDILLKLGKNPAEREKIFKHIPPLAPYKEWVGKVLDEAIRLAETDEEAPTGGNAILEAVGSNGHDTQKTEGLEG